VDQYLLNFMFGADKGLTAPITDMASVTRAIEITGKTRSGGAGR